MIPLVAAKRTIYWVLILSLVLVGFMVALTSASGLAQGEATIETDLPAESEIQTQTVAGYVEQGKPGSFVLEGLEAGDTVSGYVTGISGNLDPLLLLLPSDTTFADIGAAYEEQLRQALSGGDDPLAVIPQVADEYFLAWDDDSGSGYDATFQFEVPVADDYRMVVISSPYAQSFGDYELEVSLVPAGVTPLHDVAVEDEIIGYAQVASQSAPVSQVVSGTLTLTDPSSFAELNEIKAGDTVYVYVEALSGDLRPVLQLEDYGGKPLSSGNVGGTEPFATLQYTFPDDGANYQLLLRSGVGDSRTNGDFRLLIGINDPDVLTGQTDTPYRQILRRATRVKIGVKMDQITGVDQKSENFGVVADVRMEWNDPRLAFSADTCQCRFKTYTVSSFNSLISSLGADWPEYTVFNQQGRRDSQSPTVVVFPTGDAIYVERFSVTLQAPDFNFKRFPFDVQDFYIRFRAIFPEEFYIYEPLPGYSGLGDQLGEEEWVVEEADVFVDTQERSSRFNFYFDAYRHLSFYIFRIFVPVLLIILVSWITFFLADYSRRIEVTSGNLLVFIAFNFTVSDDLPRLGYLTFMDTVLISTFIVTALVIVLNVYLKRLEVMGKEERARKIDRFVIWFYPLAYLINGLIVTLVFFTDLGNFMM